MYKSKKNKGIFFKTIRKKNLNQSNENKRTGIQIINGNTPNFKSIPVKNKNFKLNKNPQKN